MSERMTNLSNGDVLSSIRRLVTDDLVPKVAAEEAGKLLLTPALRVVPEDETGGAEAPPSRDAFHFEPLTLRSRVTGESRAPGGIEAVVAVVGAAVEGQRQDWEPEGDPIPEAPHAFVDATWQQEWQAARVPPAEPWAQPADASDDSFIEPAPAAPQAEVWDEAEQSRADQAEAEAVAEIMADDAATPASGILSETALDLDEETLRDLVREIIREELQGTLGERITRNVRKLVRAEINRALVTRDFD